MAKEKEVYICVNCIAKCKNIMYFLTIKFLYKVSNVYSSLISVIGFWIPVDCLWFLLIEFHSSIEFHSCGLPSIPVDWVPFLWIAFYSCGLSYIPVDCLPFLWIAFYSCGLSSIPVDSCLIPLESTGMTGFLQKSVGHKKVLANLVPQILVFKISEMVFID